MSKKLFLTIIALSVLVLSHATSKNTDKTIVGVVAFSSADEENASRAKELQEVVTEAFAGNSKVTLLDRSKVQLVEKELKRQKQANYLNGKTVPQDKAYGAEILITGVLTNVGMEETKFGGSKLGGMMGDAKMSKGLVSFALEAIDVTTGETLESKTFDLAGLDGSNMEFGGVYGKEGDVENAVIKTNKDNIRKKVSEWVNNLFPPEIKIIKIETQDRKELPNEVLVMGAEDANIEQDMFIDIVKMEELTVGEKTLMRKKKVGLLRVDKMEGEVILCKVLEGKEIIEKSMTDKSYILMANYDMKRHGPPGRRR